MNRKERRKAKKIEKKLTPDERNLSQKIFLFEHLPSACNACEKAFDKSNKDMVISWQVVVREESNQVRLFCPGCLEKTQKVIEKYG